MERDVPRYSLERDGVVEDKVGEETAVLVAPGRVVRNVEPVPLEILPKQLRSQRMVLGSVLDAAVGTLERPSDRVVRLPVAELHDRGKGPGGYLDEVHGGAPARARTRDPPGPRVHRKPMRNAGAWSMTDPEGLASEAPGRSGALIPFRRGAGVVLMEAGGARGRL
jgi:hypothetical protein